MIGRQNRFHGYGSLRRVYRQGVMARGPLFAVKALPNTGRKSYRAAVVVARKVHKSAVARNRMRRQLYEALREQRAAIGPADIVITVYQDSLLEATPQQLRSQLKKQLRQAGALE
jgi:ribonuclease P protein component